MLTVSIISIFLFALLAFMIANAITWLLEVLAATARSIGCFVVKKPSDWYKNYMAARYIFSWILWKLSFAIVSPKKATKMSENHYNRKRHSI